MKQLAPIANKLNDLIHQSCGLHTVLYVTLLLTSVLPSGVPPDNYNWRQVKQTIFLHSVKAVMYCMLCVVTCHTISELYLSQARGLDNLLTGVPRAASFHVKRRERIWF